jgi:hypothetical protein
MARSYFKEAGICNPAAFLEGGGNLMLILAITDTCI